MESPNEADLAGRVAYYCMLRDRARGEAPETLPQIEKELGEALAAYAQTAPTAAETHERIAQLEDLATRQTNEIVLLKKSIVQMRSDMVALMKQQQQQQQQQPQVVVKSAEPAPSEAVESKVPAPESVNKTATPQRYKVVNGRVVLLKA